MLGAYGFFYAIYRERIEAGTEVGELAKAKDELKKQEKRVERALSAALPLTLVPLVVWLIFLGPVIEEVEAAVDVCFSFDHYSAIDVAFFAAANAWAVIALLQGIQFFRLRRKRKEIQQKLSAPATPPAG
jgi:hypothetical protein